LQRQYLEKRKFDLDEKLAKIAPLRFIARIAPIPEKTETETETVKVFIDGAKLCVESGSHFLNSILLC
jgi:hypothetical protein